MDGLVPSGDKRVVLEHNSIRVVKCVFVQR
jgi:hypothetical protein